MKREKHFETEAALCDAFMAWARTEGFTVYPETAGWDILLVASDGLQLGVEAKLALNLKVIAQALRGLVWSADRGPDFRGIVVPSVPEGVDEILVASGLEVFSPQRSWRRDGEVWTFDRQHHYNSEMFDWNPKERCELPDYVPDVPAGVPAPRTLSPWKVGALRVLAMLEVQGYVTRQDVVLCKNDPRRWCANDGWLKQMGEGKWGPGRAPRFDLDHPDIYAQIIADIRTRVGKAVAA